MDATPASVYGGSIRNSARIWSIATGSQQSVSSAASTYNIQYFHQRNSSGPNAGNPAAGGTAQDRDIFMQANLPSQQAKSPIQATRLHNTNTPATMANPRTCICLDKTFPKNCTECSSSTGMPCPKHSLIKCSNEACTKQFHKACIASLQYIDIHDEVALSGYTCMECSCRKQLEEDGMDVPFSELEGTAGHKEKLLRLGLFPIEPRGHHTHRSEENLIKSIINDMKQCMTDDEVNAILNSKPRAYPTAVKMSKEAIDKHVRWGCRFEISMRLYKVWSCDCCGRTQPGHLDSNFCEDVKNDYTAKKPTHVQQFCINHNGQTPSQFLGLTEPNAILCNKCYNNELTAEQVKAGGMCLLLIEMYCNTCTSLTPLTCINFFILHVFLISGCNRAFTWVQILSEKWIRPSSHHTTSC